MDANEKSPPPPLKAAPQPVWKPGERLTLFPPGDTGDLVASEVSGFAMGIRLTDGSAYITLASEKGERHAPASPFNQAALWGLASGMDGRPLLDERRPAEPLGSLSVVGNLPDGHAMESLVREARDQPWLIVFFRGDANAFEFSDERWNSICANEYNFDAISSASSQDFSPSEGK